MKLRLFPVRILSIVLSLLLLTPLVATAEEPAGTAEPAKRTVMIYLCGSDLETKSRMATFNLHQILSSHYGADDAVQVVVMTGGSLEWHLEQDYLYDPQTQTSPEGISSTYNQLWEARGLDAADHPGKLVLLDGDGLSGDGEAAKASTEELMNDPAVLEAFIDYCVDTHPADRYDLILWDHGSGPLKGYGLDQHAPATVETNMMSFAQLIEALGHNKVTQGGGRFDLVNFDACVMGTIECALAFADYTDYYLASPETIPGYGQEYTGWLNLLGQDPDVDTYELGKRIVDDFVKFYDDEESTVSLYSGTLAVIDTHKLLESDLTSAFSDLADVLMTQTSVPTDGEYRFYDELRSVAGSLTYGGGLRSDLGNLAALLGVAVKEVEAGSSEGSGISHANAYTAISQRIAAVLDDPSVIYARGTHEVRTADQLYLDAAGQLAYGSLPTSGLYATFATLGTTGVGRDYAAAMTQALAQMPQGERTAALGNYVSVVCAYDLVQLTGRTVTALVNAGTSKDQIDYDAVKAYLLQPLPYSGGSAVWTDRVVPAMVQLGGEDAVRPWLKGVVQQQASEAIEVVNVSAKTVRKQGGTGYEITIADTRKRVIESVNENVSVELPSVEAFLDENPRYKTLVDLVPDVADITISTNQGFLDMSDMEGEGEQEFWEAYVAWLNSDTSVYDLNPVKKELYVIRDANGALHMAEPDHGRSDRELATFAYVNTDSGPDPYILMYKDPDGDGTFTLTELFKPSDDGNYRSIVAKDLQEPMELMSARPVNLMGLVSFFLPFSQSTFVLTGQNASQIELVRVPIDEVSDVADTTGDGKAYHSKYVVQDIYGSTYDITQQIDNPVAELTSIKLATIEPAVYNGREQSPRVLVDGTVLREGTDYIVVPVEEGACRDAGSYEVILVGMGDYTDAQLSTFVISPASLSEVIVAGIEDKVYSGKAQTCNLTLTLGDMALVAGVDYTVAYADNTNVGIATITLEGQGNYTGRVTRTFAITAQDDQRTPAEEDKGSQMPTGTTGAGGSKTAVTSSSTKTLPRTGDGTPHAAMAVLLGLGGILLAGGAVLQRQR